MSQNTTPNGPSNEIRNPNGAYDLVKPKENENVQQPVYNPQQIDGSPRPQLIRIDSRSVLAPRPGFPNPLLRPPQQRPPVPLGVQFAQRPPPPQRFPGPPPNLPNQFPRPPVPVPNGALQNAPRPQATLVPNANVRPPTPFPRPQGLNVRPQGLFQQRSLPAVSQRLPFNSYPQQLRSQTLDPPEVNSNSQNANIPINSMPPENKSEIEKPQFVSMKNRSYSVNAPTVEPTTDFNEDRRRSVSSIGSIEETKPTLEMKKNEERYDYTATNKTNFNTNPIVSSSIDHPPYNYTSTTNKTNFNTTPISTIENQPYRNVNVTNPSPLPNSTPTLVSSPTPQKLEIEISKSPVKSASEEKGDKIDLSFRKTTPEMKPAKLSLFKPEGDNDSGVDESTQGNDLLSNGDHVSSKKTTRSSTPRSTTTPTKNKSFTRAGRSPSLKSPGTPTSSEPGSADKKKLPMNKIQVGSAPSPNLKVVKSKIGSLQNATHKPGGGNVKIESRKIDFSTASSRIAAKNDSYIPGGGEKKIQQQKLAWNVKSKIGSLDNASYQPKGGDKKIESMKLDFKDKAKPKVGSKDNMKYVPGGGDIKTEPEMEEIRPDIESKKLDIKVESKIGSLGNLKHKPGGGDKKIFDDKEYIRQMSAHSNASLDGSQRKKLRPKDLEFNSPEVNIISPTQQRVRILEEVQIMEFPSPGSRPSSRISRRDSSKSRRPDTPRPPWRY